ncbi:MAG TPA: hypothetical protein PK950_02710, partial [Candidatus Paceibacterota bacterium]|nr:hypothetical protein [Candidatus Paceibacterota bacterium]
PTAVSFSGRAYPLSRVTILRDNVIAITTIAGPDARFSVMLDGLNQGNYSFSVYSEDAGGRKSGLFSFPLYITEGATTTISGIFISPTIDVDKTTVKKGDNLTIFGTSAPNSAITISVHSPVEHFVEASTDETGSYLYTFNTSILELGSHATKSKAVLGSAATEFGKEVSFSVGSTTTPKDKKCNARGDLDTNCRINIVDFSVMAFWYKRADVPPEIDLNGDGAITIVDFSILAFGWTG